MIGQSMRKIIETSSYSQSAVARHFGISSQRLNQYLTNKNEPDLAFIVKFCDFFGITPNILLGYEASIDKTSIYDSAAKVVAVVENFITLHKIKMDTENKAQLIAGLIVKILSTPKEEQATVVKCVLEWEADKRAIV